MAEILTILYNSYHFIKYLWNKKIIISDLTKSRQVTSFVTIHRDLQSRQIDSLKQRHQAR